MARSIRYDVYGGPEVLRLVEGPDPVAGPGQLRVRVTAAGLNPADWKAREGKLSRYFEYKFPFVLGFDLSGTVAAVGAGVEGVKPGDAVFGKSNWLDS
ncbi:MAG: alcohol dehydrogenase catalytic domain-containing protein, partial [Cellulomonas sp.]|nr:alcohol dehydrogenase catalytic domain-containing protein [Cellulomonas sp.]